MHYGLIVSLILHLGLLGWTLLSIERTPPLAESKPEPVEISILDPDDIVRLKKGERDSKNLEAEGREGVAKEPPKKDPPKPVPPPTPVAAAPPPPAPAPEPPAVEPPKPEPPKPDPIAEKLASAVEPKPAPTPDDQKLLDEKLAEADLAASAEAKAVADAKLKSEAEAKAKAEAERKKKLAEEERKKKELERKRLADLKAKSDAKKAADAKAAQSLDSIVNAALAKAPDQSAPPKALLDKALPKPAQAAGTKSDTPTALKGPAAGAREGTDNKLTADKLSMIARLMREKVNTCWKPNTGMEGASKLIVKATIELSRDGRLAKKPVIINSGSDPRFLDAADAATRALIDCQPYDMLPPELYVGGWDLLNFTFDPSKMF